MFSIGNVQLENPILLAPIAGYCDLPFRLIVRSITGPSGGVGLACTDLLCPQAVLSENDKSMWLAATCPDDQPLCMQLYGADANPMAQAARWAQAQGATTIDINMGCPVDKVTKKNGGSTLLCDPVNTIALAKQIVDAVDIPVTAKIRLGWNDETIITDSLPPKLADVGIAAITVHGRTTEQKFRGDARIVTDGNDCIHAVVQAMQKHHPNVPVIGNGDIKSPQDAKRMMNLTGCSAVMIGRGALGQPWLFRDTAHYLRTCELLDPYPRVDRARAVLQHFKHMLDYRDARYALYKIRSRISWYSPHLQPWPHLRRNVHDMKSANGFIEYFEQGIERLEKGELVGLEMV